MTGQLHDKWWLYERPRMALRAAVDVMLEVLVIAVTSKTVMPLRVPRAHVFSNTVDVFALDGYGDQAVLSSSLHQLWAITYGSGMRNDPRYTPSDVFETFPRPVSTESLVGVGRSLDDRRREIMLRRNLGLTKLYNLVNDPAMAGRSDADAMLIRDLHVELDLAVLASYGWSDIDPLHGFYTFRNMERFTVAPAVRVEILDRLLTENHRRAGAGATKTGARSRDGIPGENGTLFA